MGVGHQPWLVLLSLAVAIQGAYVGLSLAVQVRDSIGLRRRLLLAAAAVSLAVAIWSMHFVAMLAVQLPFAIDYLVLPTLLSFLLCVIVVGVAVFAVSARRLSFTRLSAAAVFMGGGIATMHYIGMSALRASALCSHAPSLVVASVVVGIAASGLALWLASGQARRPPLFLSAAALGMAIAGMHYTAMAGLTLAPLPDRPLGAPVLSADLLAIVVAIVAFLVSGIFLLTLVPDRTRNAFAVDLPIAGADGLGPEAAAEAAPRRHIALHLPVEREGGTRFVPIEDVVAVHANAHYTYLFDGKDKLFCPLPIGVVESRLDRSRFVRIHRSHIVAIDRITGLKRSGDTGVVELAALEPYTVPVSRGRLPRLKSRLEMTIRESAIVHTKPVVRPSFAVQHR